MTLPAPIVPLSDIALFDEAAETLGQSIAQLMDNAGAALAHEAMRLCPNGMIVVACGPGNNGGDGYVCARLLAESGRSVMVWEVVPPKSALCKQQAALLPQSVMRSTQKPTQVPALVVDAILGAGSDGKLRESIVQALQGIMQWKCPILSADVPTGIGTQFCLPATLTLCFQVAKSELLAQNNIGEFKTVDIGLSPHAYQMVQPACLRHFPKHKLAGHKGSHGELLIIGGGAFPGALEFCARAAVKSGCDLVRVWTADGPPLPPTIVVHRQQEGRVLRPANPEEIMPLLVRASAVLIGPGLGREASSVEAAHQAFSLAIDMGIPTILDADAIAALSDAVRDLPEHEDATILLTPHRGEARTLLGGPTSDEAIHAYARPNRVVLAKSKVDLVTDGRRWQLNPRGNPRMAVGGTGDVLAGIAAGLMARGASPFDAARMAVLWVTCAGDVLWDSHGPCYDALHLIDQLPASLKSLLEPLKLWPPVTDK
jgi:ADP-dependent NAD(P)H-hydrate dehydratase / NAD(P)H-hydrate epimerase